MNPETELLETEEKYVNSLKFIIKAFLIPLEKYISELKILYENPNLDSREKQSVLYVMIKKEKLDLISIIFSNIQQLLECNLVILSILQEHTFPVIHRQNIIQNFSKVLPTLKFYGDYIKNYETSREVLKRLEGDIRFISFIRAIELQEESQNLTLESQLSKPWQRIMKYELLLREIKERAEPGEEQETIARSIEEIRKINQGLNKIQAANMNQKLLLEKEKAYGLKDISAPARYYVRDGLLKVTTSSSRKKEVSFLLCNDILFYGRRSGTLTQAQFKSCDIHDIVVIRHPEKQAKTFLLRISAEEGTDRGLFLPLSLSLIALLSFLLFSSVVFQVEASSEDECDQWLADLVSLKNDDQVRDLPPSTPSPPHFPHSHS
jgi:hypothetical protein